MNTPSPLAAASRWTARIIGTLLVLGTLTIAIGEGMPNPLTQPAWAQLIFFALALAMIGILIGWRWELAGGILSLAGFSLGLIPMKYYSVCGLTWFYLALALPGVLYVTSALLRCCDERRPLVSNSTQL